MRCERELQITEGWLVIEKMALATRGRRRVDFDWVL